MTAEKIVSGERRDFRHACAGLARSAFTLMRTPPHDKLHVDAEKVAGDEKQPLVTPIADILSRLQVLVERREYREAGSLGLASLTYLSSALMQFTDHTNIGSEDIDGAPNFEQIEALRAECERRCDSSGPLHPAEQFDAALSLTGRVDESLMLLWAASRHYARWLDSTMLPNEVADRQQRLDAMLAWRKTLQAHKTGDDGPQDPAGDNYYMWTHALAQYIWRVSSNCHPAVNHVASQTFLRGTDLMHGIVHRFNKQSVPNDHTAAANYGNELGDAIVRYCSSTTQNLL